MNVPELEKQYLDAKIAYYEGREIMPDFEFDLLERILIESGSKVVHQVGYKRKDFDYSHPTPMLSLSKIQMEPENIMEDSFITWYRKRAAELKSRGHDTVALELVSSAKYDGNAVNLVYKGSSSSLYHVLTRGDGLMGKNITDRMKIIVPSRLNFPMEETDTLEIRCEVVIERELFDRKYSADFANPRNFVAGILGGDEFSHETVKDLTVVPLHYVLNGNHIDPIEVSDNFLLNSNFHIFEGTRFLPEEYGDVIRLWVNSRETNPYQLDGIVLSFDAKYRSVLGENSHDPEWAVAIKFVPEEAQSELMGIEWAVGKTGELAPVVLLNPVRLAGTMVKRASAYNAGFVINNQIGPGSSFVLVKAGDIIPEVKTVLTKSTSPVVLPDKCPSCSSTLSFDGIHLNCPNLRCYGRVSKILSVALKTFDIKGVGEKTISPFAKDFSNIVDIISWVRAHGRDFEIAKYGFAPGGRAHEKFVSAFENIKSIPMSKVIQSLGYPNVGKKLSEQVSNEMCGTDFDYAGLERSLVKFLQSDETRAEILHFVKKLEESGIRVERPQKIDNSSVTFVCLTGSPTPFGFSTKGEFIESFKGRLMEVSISDKRCNFLVTNDLNSKTSKMQNANKRGIPVVTYDHKF